MRERHGGCRWWLGRGGAMVDARQSRLEARIRVCSDGGRHEMMRDGCLADGGFDKGEVVRRGGKMVARPLWPRTAVHGGYRWKISGRFW
ncbi:unnamed protein product [Sphenostylis stenocarpa]|uniref:Uncharacterized protein n=1 Tax=Sphenostylis stenocarpa TaxID=92480 RepID=A0AA86VMN3_9FABA|nr:unnamed protein product [Sphenostylis stenocarpa]